jgi:hypothetical protein
MKIAMRSPNLSGQKGSPGVRQPAFCQPRHWLVPRTGPRWKNTQSHVIDGSEHERPLAGGDYYIPSLGDNSR